MNIDIKIDQCEDYKKIEILIKCPKLDDRLLRLIEKIKENKIVITGKKDGRTYSLIAEDLYYIESVDNKSFLYDKKEIYESDLKLYEFERLVEGTNFIRISKNLIANTTYIESVRALFNGRFEATLMNKEKVIVNRHYVKSFKEKFLT
ncbi:LytTR family DNA-binding domain-containing protein [Sporosarcina jiandibaonis]|uniref:LytTR family DNA-binding domain-containing protein n=1 Tax=Sporosarcina jiandibaonis TaxID=2715535 RepID=UPI001551F743|nr:LytTR family DNA-binding domain-containing protein [Sporosarcina jiandibaonis]